ncbi:MAG: hypothetical protein JNK82_36260 [Myxococcaceae bacterium]|nr:hypothetical protein [Myxococcaceae bacterium]
MRYELLVQPKDVGTPYDPAPVEALLTARGATDQPDGSKLWRLKAGEVEVRRLNENGVAVATELKVQLTDKTDLIRELVIEGAQLASDAGLKLVDPNLSKTLSANDDGLVADSYFRTARYAGEYLGVSSAVMASWGTSEPEGLKPGTKVLLGIGGFFLLLYIVVERIL